MKNGLKYLKESLIETFKEVTILGLFFFVLVQPIDCYIMAGGGILNISDRVEVDTNYKVKGSFNYAYVTERNNILLNYIISKFKKEWEVEEIADYSYDTNETYEDLEVRSKLEMDEAESNALAVAYSHANKSIKVKSTKIMVNYVTKTLKNTDFEIGDQIISVDNKKVISVENYRDYINSKNIGDVVKVKVINKNKEYIRNATIFEEDGNKYSGIGVSTINIYDLKPNTKIKSKDSESGPSGGLMLTLEIYNKLVKEDITNGLTIVGTGTIDEDGKVGSIGGVKYKLMGAVEGEADIFLVPDGENYKEAIKFKKKKGYKIKIIPIKTFNEALEKLKKLK